MERLNENPIKYGDYELYFIKTKYVYGGTAIVAMTEDEETYAYISINLSSYDEIPPEDCIFLNHDLSDDFEELFREHFVEETVKYCQGGFVLFECVRLKKELMKG